MTNATNATVEETAKLFNIALAGDKYEFTGATKDVVIDEGENWTVTYRQIRALKDFQTIDEKTVKAGTCREFKSKFWSMCRYHTS